MATLPPGVTLQPIDGGPTYFADHGFTYAVNMGWDDPDFFSIGIWSGSMNSDSDASRWADLGLNTLVGIGPSYVDASILNRIQTNGISLISSGGTEAPTPPPSNAPYWVGNIASDELTNYADAFATPVLNTTNAAQDNRFWYENNNYFFPHTLANGGGLSPYEPSTALAHLTATPNGTQRHIDISSTDTYWFAGAHANVSWVLGAGAEIGAGGVIDAQGRDMTPDEAARGSMYGDAVDLIRELQVNYYPAPIAQFIETGGPYFENTTGTSYITPPELNWAVWSSLIHGARQIIYFDHTFGGPAQSYDNLSETFYQTVQPGQTISIYDQVKATDAMVKQMAPVLNSPFAFGYVHVNGGYNDLTPVYTLGGIETAAHYYSGTFYIFADTRESKSQHNIPATFILNDPSAVSVTVVDENRTIPVVNGSFSDTFANASAVHIYQVNDGPGVPPPPGVPPAPVISTFSPDTAPVGDGHTTATVLTLMGIGVAGTKIDVVDGSWVGTTTVNSTGHWSLATGTLAVGPHSFSATDSNANGTSPSSATLVVTVISSTLPPPSTNLVTNGGFETGDFSGWTLSGNVAPLSYGPQAFLTNTAQSGQSAAAFGPVGSDGMLSQDIQTTAGQYYTLSFWLANASGGPNDFTAKWNGQTLLALVNQSAQGYTEYTYDVVGTSGTSHLEFDFRQDPSHWSLDSISVTADGTQTTPGAGSVSINDVTISEGNSGTKVATFTITRSGGTAAFDVNYATANATATVADSDYVAASNTLHFGANENTKTISVTINGDTKVEANETFNVVLSNATNGATISDSQGWHRHHHQR